MNRLSVIEEVVQQTLVAQQVTGMRSQQRMKVCVVCYISIIYIINPTNGVKSLEFCIKVK